MALIYCILSRKNFFLSKKYSLEDRIFCYRHFEGSETIWSVYQRKKSYMLWKPSHEYSRPGIEWRYTTYKCPWAITLKMSVKNARDIFLQQTSKDSRAGVRKGLPSSILHQGFKWKKNCPVCESSIQDEGMTHLLSLNNWADAQSFRNLKKFSVFWRYFQQWHPLGAREFK